MAQIDAILLAAGESRRMGSPKPLLKVGGETFIEHLSLLLLGSVRRLLIVLGADAELLGKAVPADHRIGIVVNRDYAHGQLSSLKAGLRQVAADTDAVLVHLCDHPLIKPETPEMVLRAHRENSKPIVIPRYRGRRGHPVLFAREVFGELLAADESVGAREVVNRDPSRVEYVDVDDPGICLDLDTPDDLKKAGIVPG